MALVTLQEADDHLRLDLQSGDEREADVLLKMEQATDIVLDYLKTEESGWDEETVPRSIHAAILLVLGDLWEAREGGAENGDYISPNGTVARLLHRFRDPALA